MILLDAGWLRPAHSREAGVMAHLRNWRQWVLARPQPPTISLGL